MLSQKCQYALRAVFELAKHYGNGPMKIGNVATTQAIPHRFLEVILNQLKQAGFVDSRRGSGGGYFLTRDPKSLTVGELIRFVDGSVAPVSCLEPGGSRDCPLHGDCVFMGLWQRAQDALSGVYDTTSFVDLVEQERTKNKEYVPQFDI